MTADGLSLLLPGMQASRSAPEGPAPKLEWRGIFENAEVNALHAECFGQPASSDDWWSRVNSFSLGWVCARAEGRLVGFVNVAWDGAVHAFVLDSMVTGPLRRHGLASLLVAEAVRQAKSSGCEWLHVDFEPRLRALYVDACGFTPTDAGLIALR